MDQNQENMMPKYKVAQLSYEGENVILVPMDRSFGKRPQEQKDQELSKLQAAADATGLNGKLVIIWDAAGSVAAFGPDKLKGYAESLRWTSLRTKMNCDLDCD
jgi:hypothetical protein